ncbi:MAG: DUF2079 domain-containing protein [Actinomycetota bacterium]|nr:DUF2079 domain-containing protein [Actinomycetota bacterium]
MAEIAAGRAVPASAARTDSSVTTEASDDVDVSRLLAWARRQDPVPWILGGMMLVWTVTFVALGWLRHARFATFSYDLGIYDQDLWLLSQFKEPFGTVRGLNFFGQHLNPALLLLVPAYWLGAGPEFLLIVQVAAQASGAVAVYLLARDRLADRWLALVLAGALLLNPTYQFLTWEFFHPDALAVAPVLFAYWAARRERWGWFTVAAVLAAACKEDVALVLVAMGVLVALRQKNLRVGLTTVVLASAWYLVGTRVVMPAVLGGLNPFYDAFFGELGANAGEVVRTVLTNPVKPLDLATRTDRINYLRLILGPVAFLPVASLSTFFVALPILAVNLVATFPYTRDFKYHYSALIVAAALIATVEGIARIARKPSTRRFFVGLVAASSLATSVAWGPSPIASNYDIGYWPLTADRRLPTFEAAVAMVPEDASVSATFSFVPHLTHRTHIYDWPEPWRLVNWGIRGENLHDPGGVEWIVLDRRPMGESDRKLLERLLQGEFEIRLDKEDVLVAQRVRPGGRVEIPT